MLRRDFTKSNKEYFKQNKSVLIGVLVFLLVGILVFAIFGMNGNFEFAGYNEFSVTVSEKTTKDFGTYQREIGDIVNSYGGKFDNVSIYGEGDDTKFVVRYMKDLTEAQTLEINKLVAEKVGVDLELVSAHSHVGPAVKNSDYVYTAVSILLVIVLVTIFAYARYNGASALAVLLSTLLGTIGFMSIGAILRFQIGMSYFAMLVILNMLISYVAITIFEKMHKSSWLMSENFGTAIETAVKSSRFRICVLSISLLVVGLLFVLLAPSTIKYVSINLMFMAVLLLAVGLYVIPFVWSVFITKARKRNYKIKASTVETK